MEDFSGKSVLITGGGSGTGAHMARAFADSGATVKITGRRAEPLQAVASHSDRIRYQAGDASDEATVASFFEDGPFQIVVANAGIAESAPLKATSLDQWQRIMAVNATGVFLIMRDGLKQMDDWGRLIVVSSILGKHGAPYASAYAASKHATIGLVESVAHEVARSNVTINAICPGYIDTDMTGRTLENIMEKTGMDRADALKAITKDNPQGKLITCDEVTHTAFYLASEGASTINGQAIMLCGGGF
ncbi:MAG: SDR family oxidoreductase [Pseudomonadota bacterium]